MKLSSLALTVLALALLSCGQGKRTAAAQGTSQPAIQNAESPPYLTNAQPRLQTMKLYLGSKELKTELAMKPVEIYTGMMWRTNMPDGEAMLFVFPSPEQRAFYMRNTYVPLSVAYIDPGGTILEIYDLQPRNEVSVPSKSDNIQFVLEVPQGWFKRNNIAPGTVVRSQFGELKTVFSFRRTP